MNFSWGVVTSTLATTVALAVGCGATEDGGETGPDSGSDSDAPDVGVGNDGVVGDDDAAGDGGKGPGSGEYCQEAPVDFVPQPPTVYVLVDRSGSIFDANLWVPLRDAVLPVIKELQADVRFGFGSYTGTSGSCVGVTDSGAIGLNNFETIKTAYTGLGKPPGKLETPSTLAIKQVTEILKRDTAHGEKFIMLVTGDADPDFCDDGDVRCGADSLVARLQVSANEGVKSFVFGVENKALLERRAYLDYFAQAGAGQRPNWPEALNLQSGINNCSQALFSEARTANGNDASKPAGKYDAAGGTAAAFLSADTTAIANEIRSRVAGLKSCTLDLATSGVSVKAGGDGDIFVNEEIIPDDQWEMTSPTVLQLTGAACETWKKPEVTKFFAGFTCDQLVK